MKRSGLPYFPVIIDANYGHFLYAISQCLCCHGDGYRKKLCQGFVRLWTSESNANLVMPLLSVRTGFDLFLRAKSFPKGSEVIMSAVNIPDMITIVRSHGLAIVPLDIAIDNLEPKIEHLPALISDKTVAIVVAHLYGRWADMEPIISTARQHGLSVIEDCAESFCGFDHIGDPRSDIALFSFGGIKFYTSFGGCIAKIRDADVYDRMNALHCQYPIQTSKMYMRKVLKYSMMYTLMQVGCITRLGRNILNWFTIDYKFYFVKMMRGFPDRMIEMIRWQPSSAMLSTMLHRHESFNQFEFNIQRAKGEYFLASLPKGLEPVGIHVRINNHWLFPVLSVKEDPDTVVTILNALGVDAYRGSSQLRLVEPCSPDGQAAGQNMALEMQSTSACQLYPREARYLMDHVVYLPVSKFVPYPHLDKMAKVCQVALRLSRQSDSILLQADNVWLVKSKL